MLVDVLSRQSLFEGNQNLIQKIASIVEIVHFEPSQPVIAQGEPDTDIYFILLGELVVSPNGRDDVVRAAGTFVGEMAAIDPSAVRSATVRSKERSVLAKLSERKLTEIANSYPFVWRQLARELGSRLRERTAKVDRRSSYARLFIGSTREALHLASLLRAELQKLSIDSFVWTDGIFIPGATTIEALEAELKRADFAAVFLSPDDEVVSRGVAKAAPRDNVLFELGLFTGAIGRHRSLMIQPSGVDLKIPSDLFGVTPISYHGVDMNAVAIEVAKVVARLGPK